MLAQDVPERWREYFELTGEDLGCGESCDESCVVRSLGEQSGERAAGARPARRNKPKRVNCYGEYADDLDGSRHETDAGTAARYFPQFRYCPKASRRDRNEGCEGMEAKAGGVGCERPSGSMHERYGDANGSGKAPANANHHPCVKPTPLLEWLVRLACPPGGTVLDPFCGSGSTGKACMRAGRNFVGVERDSEWLPVARARIEHERAKTPLIADAG